MNHPTYIAHNDRTSDSRPANRHPFGRHDWTQSIGAPSRKAENRLIDTASSQVWNRNKTAWPTRSWEKPKRAPAKPSLVLHKGFAEPQGTGACAHSMWSFKNGTYIFRVEEAGCGASEGFDGSLVVENGGREILHSDCRPGSRSVAH